MVWVIEFRNQGLDGINPKKRGRPSIMTKYNKSSNKQVKKEYSEE